MSSNPLATALVAPFERLRMTDVESVGGKNASLGEMISQLAASGVRVPGGFATTAHAFRQFLQHEGLAKRIEDRLSTLDTDDVRALAVAGAEIRHWIESTPFPPELDAAITESFANLTEGNPNASFAVRSSATAEDLPDAPRTRDFPGETFRVLKDREMREYGEYRTGRLVLAAWDALGAWGPARSGGSGERGPATAVAW